MFGFERSVMKGNLLEYQRSPSTTSQVPLERFS